MADLIADFQAAQREQQRRQRLEAANNMDYDPDRAGRIFAVAAKTRLPNEVVDADLETLEAKLRADEFSYENYTDAENGAPVFNDFAAEHPYNFAVMDRDRKNMSWIEKTWTMNGLGWDQGWATSDLTNIVNRRLEGDKREGDEERMKQIRMLLEGGDFGADDTTQKLLVGMMNQLPIQAWLIGQSAEEAMLLGEAGALAGGLAAGVPTGGAFALPGVVAGFFTGIGAGGWAGRTEAAFRMQRALAYDEYEALGLDPMDARMAANVVGAVTAPMESLGLAALTKRLPGFKNVQKNLVDKYIKSIFTKPTVLQATGRFALQYGEGLATEVFTEVMQESVQMSTGEFLKRNARDAGDMRPELDPMTDEQYWEALGEVVEQTIYATALMGSAGPVTSFVSDARRAKASKQQALMWQSLGEAAEESTTRTDTPSAWEEFVSRVQEKGPLTEIRIDADGFRKYWQSKEIDPEKAAKDLGIDLAESEAMDVDVVIPFKTFIDKIAPTEHHAGLMPSYRLHEGEMTFREAEDFHANQEQKIETLKAQLAEDFDMTPAQTIEDDLTPQLVAAGYQPKVAATQAKLQALIFVTTADKAGIDAVELYRARFGGIAKEVPEALSRQDVDIETDPLLDRIRAKDFPTQREIYGESLFDLIRNFGGIQDQGGELGARDVQKQFPGMVSTEGLTIDAAAELAFDRGYITQYDSAEFMEAFDRELGGTQVFGRQARVNTRIEELLGQMETAAAFFEEEGIDLDNMTNQQVRDYLKGVKTLQQTGESDLKKWTDLVFTIAMRQELLSDEQMEVPFAGKMKMDPLLARAEAMRPRLADQQDFKDVEFTDKVTLPNGRTGTRKISAQKQYDRAVKKRNLLKRLLDCVNG